MKIKEFTNDQLEIVALEHSVRIIENQNYEQCFKLTLDFLKCIKALYPDYTLEELAEIIKNK